MKQKPWTCTSGTTKSRVMNGTWRWTMTGSRKGIAAAGAVLLMIVGLFPIAVKAAGTYDLLRIDASPRGAALGSFPVSLSYHDLSAVMHNPAGLVHLEGKQASVVYNDLPLDPAGGFLAYGQPMAQGYVGVGVTYLDYGEFDRIATFDAGTEGSFGASEFLVSGSYGRVLPWAEGLSAGATVKFMYGSIEEYTSSAVGLDLGLLWRTGYHDWDVAASASNLGTQLSSYDGFTESLPTTFRVGIAKQLEHLPLQLTATGHYELEEDIFATFAGEFTVDPKLLLRVGYTTLATDFKVESDRDSIAGFSAGIGVRHKQLRLDYAVYAMGALGEVHRIGIGATL
ncbi:PorV/PorQ family protein [bacterium]|nr:PorV/PorQ family protein [bacterium]